MNQAGLSSCIALGNLLDSLDKIALIGDSDGRIRYETSRLEDMVSEGVDGALLRSELTRLVRATAEALGGLSRAEPPARTVRTRSAEFRIAGALFGIPGPEPLVVAGACLEREDLDPPLPSADLLRSRYRMTPRQAEVALLLAQRKTNAEVAGALGISSHTARHHTEAVLAKLDVGDRRRVRPVLESVEEPCSDGAPVWPTGVTLVPAPFPTHRR